MSLKKKAKAIAISRMKSDNKASLRKLKKFGGKYV